MTLRHWWIGAAAMLTACGGAVANEPPAASSNGATTGDAEEIAESTPEPEAPPAFEADAVVGLWCEYWTTPTAEQGAPARGVDTQHYLFLEDGRWGWRAPDENGGEPRRRHGSWRVVGESIVLMDETGAAVDRLPVTDCPPNPEAEEIDTRYRCRSLGGKAFWRTKPVTEVDTAQYIESPGAE